MLIKRGNGPNPLKGWQVERSAIRTIGRDLRRPECILAERDGTLWAADARGGVMRINPDGTQALIAQSPDDHFDLRVNSEQSLLFGTLPNGLAFSKTGDILIANFGTDRLELMTRDGKIRTLYDSLDGKPLGKVNFVMRDSRDRIWITVSTRVNPWDKALRSTLADGYILLLDEHGLRVAAEGFAFTNEVKFDADEEWLYIAESAAKRVTRMRVTAKGELTDREIYGPANLGDGFIDGISFDSDGNHEANARAEAEYATGNPISFETLNATGGSIATWLACVTFGGADLKTAYLGGLKASTIPYFESPVAGLPLAHW